MMFSQWPKSHSHTIFKRLAKALISLRVCAGWSELLLVGHTTLLEISCHGSFVVVNVAAITFSPGTNCGSYRYYSYSPTQDPVVVITVTIVKALHKTQLW